jgi:Tfp pilus assembly protein PilF
VNWGEGNLAEARRVLERAVKLSNRYADLYLVLGRIAEKQGDTEMAAASYERVLALDPENHEVPHRWLAGARR